MEVKDKVGLSDPARDRGDRITVEDRLAIQIGQMMEGKKVKNKVEPPTTKVAGFLGSLFGMMDKSNGANLAF